MIPKVKAWMESMGFLYYEPKYMPHSSSWRGNGMNFTDDEATFMYRQYLQGKIEELKHVESRGLSGTYYWYNNGEYHEISISDRIAELEYELKELEK